jgi:hypothetical protein
LLAAADGRDVHSLSRKGIFILHPRLIDDHVAAGEDDDDLAAGGGSG